MDPGHAIARGVKICASNPGLAVLSWAVSLATTLALVVPLAVAIALVVVALAAKIPPDATGEEIFLGVLTVFFDHWGAALAAYAAAVLWIGLVLFLYLYAQAGVLGCVVRCHRKGPAGDRALRPALGATPAFKVFTGALWWEEVKAQGWRVTLVATAYSIAALVPVLLYSLWGYACFRLALGGEMKTALGVAGAILGLVPTLAILWVLGVHYRFGVTVAVLRGCGWREAVSGANGVFRTRTLAALAVVAATIGARYVVGMAGLLLSLPFLVLSVLPVAGLLFVLPRIIIGLLQGFVGAGINVAALGATAAVCEPIEAPAAGAPTTAD